MHRHLHLQQNPRLDRAPTRCAASILGGRATPLTGWWWLLLLLAGLLAHSQAAPARYHINEWQTDQGLPQNVVNAVAQTADGYLWCGTANGLARFDGLNFQIFNAETHPQLGSGRIRQLFTDRRGALWISTLEGGLIRFKDNQFSALPPRGNDQSAISSFADDSTGNLWLGTEAGVVWFFNGQQFTNLSAQWEPNPNTAYRVINDFNGSPWLASRFELARLAPDSKPNPVLKGPFAQYEFLAPSRSGGWWINMGGRVRLWREGQWIAERGAPAWIDRLTVSCLEDRAGHLWIGTRDRGVYRYDQDGSVHSFAASAGLGSDLIGSLCEDSEGNLWVGSNGGGLNRLRPALFQILGRTQQLTSNLVTAIAETNDSTLWIGTTDSGINQLHNGVVTPLDPAAGFNELQIQTALTDSSGQLWVATASGSLYRRRQNTFQLFALAPELCAPIRSLFEDSKQRLWIGQQNRNRLLYIENGEARTLEIPNRDSTLTVQCITEDANATLWIGTDGHGLFAYAQGAFRQYRQADGLPSDTVRSLYADTDGTLWIGTLGGGLTRLKDQRLITCRKADGLPDNVVNSIEPDAQGCFWISSFQGIYRVNKADLNGFADGRLGRIQCVQFGKSDGLPALETAGGFQPASCKTSDGRLWFPTVKGVAAVDPSQWTPNPVAPPVFIEEIRIDNAPAPLAAGSAIEIAPGTHRYEIKYTGLSFSAPEQVQFKYRVEGLDKDWVQAGRRRVATYNYIPPGNYRFHVIACNQDGLWNNTGASLAFTVAPQLWQRPSFLVAAASLLALAFASAIRAVARRRLHRQVLKLEMQHKVDAERNRIAQDIHDDLGAGLTQIGWLGEATVKHAAEEAVVRERATKIANAARDMVRSLDEIVWAVRPENDSLVSLAEYLGHRIDELFESTSTRCWFSAGKDLPDLAVAAETRHNIYLSCKEALNNVLKHSGAKEVRVELTYADPHLHIQIRDNGRGFDPAKSAASGNGLRNMRERIEKLGGSFSQTSDPQHGTRIDLRVPLASTRPA